MEENAKLIWLFGGYYYRHKIINIIKSQLPDSQCIIYEDNYSIEDIRISISQGDVFNNSNKIIIIKSIIKTTKWEALLDSIPENCLIIFDNINTKHQLFKYVSKNGKTFLEDPNLEKDEVLSVIVKQFEDAGKHIDIENAKYIIRKINSDRKTYDSDLVYLFVLKCILFIGKSKEIKKDDINNMCSFFSYYSAFDIFDYLDKKDYASSYNLIRKAIEIDGINAITSVLFASLWKYRLLLLVKESRTVLDEDQTKELLRNIYKFSGDPYIAGKTEDGKIKPCYSEYSVMTNLNSKGLNSYSRKDLYLIVKYIENAIFISRTSNNDSITLLLIDTLLLYICYVVPMGNLENNLMEYSKEVL